jgi:hypothetical protein
VWTTVALTEKPMFYCAHFRENVLKALYTRDGFIDNDSEAEEHNCNDPGQIQNDQPPLIVSLSRSTTSQRGTGFGMAWNITLADI